MLDYCYWVSGFAMRRCLALFLVFLLAFPVRSYAFFPVVAAVAESALGGFLASSAARTVAIYAAGAGVLGATMALPGAYGEFKAEVAIKGALLSALATLPEASSTSACSPDYGYRSINATLPNGGVYSSTATCTGGVAPGSQPGWNTLDGFCSNVGFYATPQFQFVNTGIAGFVAHPFGPFNAASVDVVCEPMMYPGYAQIPTWHVTVSMPSTAPANNDQAINNLVSNPGGASAVDGYIKSHPTDFSNGVGNDVSVIGMTPTPGNYATPSGDAISVASDGSVSVNGQTVPSSGISSIGQIGVDANTGAPTVDGVAAVPGSASVPASGSTGTSISGLIDVTPGVWTDPASVPADTRTFADVFDAHRLVWESSELVAGINHLFPSSGPSGLPVWSVTLMGNTYSFNLADWSGVLDTFRTMLLALVSLYSLMILLGRGRS